MISDLTIIILTYNSSHVIKNCLDKINFNKYEVIVVDNASKDQTIKLIKENYPQIKLINLNQNIGYGNGNNIALNQVKTAFALVLNPDAIILEKDIEKVLETMKQNSDIALAGPLILDTAMLEQEIQKKSQEINSDLNGPKKNYYQKIGNNILSRFISGAALFMNMKILQQIGFFDKNIFLYYEDEELCLRSISKGYKNLLICDAYAFHVGQASCKSSLRNTYLRNWHFNGWSKLYLRQVNKGKFKAKRLAIKLVILNFIKSIFYLLRFKLDKFAAYLGSSFGAFAFLIGLKAFKNNGIPRG